METLNLGCDCIGAKWSLITRGDGKTKLIRENERGKEVWVATTNKWYNVKHAGYTSGWFETREDALAEYDKQKAVGIDPLPAAELPLKARLSKELITGGLSQSNVAFILNLIP